MNQIDVAQRVVELRDRILRAGGKNVGIVAVTKTFGAQAWLDAKSAGCEAVGENYAQEIIAKSDLVPRADRLPVHFIGQLQTNKIKSLFDIVDVWQSVDRAAVVSELVKRHAARTSDSRCEIFLQINTTNEPD